MALDAIGPESFIKVLCLFRAKIVKFFYKIHCK